MAKDLTDRERIELLERDLDHLTEIVRATAFGAIKNSTSLVERCNRHRARAEEQRVEHLSAVYAERAAAAEAARAA